MVYQDIKPKLIFFSKLAAIFILSYGVSSILVSGIFIGYSPTVRPNPRQYVQFKIDKLIASVRQTFHLESTLKESSSDTNFLKQVTEQIAPGVRAADVPGKVYFEYDIDKVQWKIIEYTTEKGEKIKVRVPQGMSYPKEINTTKSSTL